MNEKNTEDNITSEEGLSAFLKAVRGWSWRLGIIDIFVTLFVNVLTLVL
jgi:hypothetical protein